MARQKTTARRTTRRKRTQKPRSEPEQVQEKPQEEEKVWLISPYPALTVSTPSGKTYQFREGRLEVTAEEFKVLAGLKGFNQWFFKR